MTTPEITSISQFTAWEIWIHNNVVVILLIISLGFGLLLWMANRLLNQHKDFNKEKKILLADIDGRKEKAEETALIGIAEKIEGLVKQVTDLFSGQREMNADMSKIKERVGTTEKRLKSTNDVIVIIKEENNVISKKQGVQEARCIEREKAMADKFKVLHHRVNEPLMPIDRCDREN